MAKRDKTYNGWTNYETWNVSLWITNSEAQYNRMVFYANIERMTLKHMAEAVKQHVFSLAKHLTPLAYGDLTYAQLSNVNWREIAKHYLEDFKRA